MAEFNIGDLVWAKMKGYSPWPAKIIEPVKNVKPPKSKEPVHCVIFFGTRRQIAYVAASDILTFEEGKAKCGQKKMAGAYKAAVEEMYEAALSERNTSSRSSSTYDDDDDDDDDDDTNESSQKLPQSLPKTSKPFSKQRAKPIVRKPMLNSLRKALFNPEENQKFSIKRAANKSNVKSIEKRRRLTNSPVKPVSLQVAKKSLRSSTPPSASAREASSSGPTHAPRLSSLLSSIPLPLYDQDTVIEDIHIHLSSTKIGFIGLGTMGKIILNHLLKSKTKRTITIWNRTIEKCKEFERKGCTVAKSPADLMTKSDIVISCLSDRSAVNEVVRDMEVGILSALTFGKGYVEMTTVDPDFSKSICRDITTRRGRYLEVPMLGRRKHAKDASLLLLAAGDKELFKACCNCFRDMGEHVFFLGDVGNASKMNLIVNMVLGTCFATVTEAMSLAEHIGISSKDTMELLEQGSLNCPAIIEQGNAILNMQEDPSKEFDNIPVEHMQRNLHLALEVAHNYVQPTPTIAAVNIVYQNILKISPMGKHRIDVSEMHKVNAKYFNDIEKATLEEDMDE